jgi:hypothetical protein
MASTTVIGVAMEKNLPKNEQISWVERYSCHTASTPFGNLLVMYKNNGYTIFVFGAKLKSGSKTVKSGK